MVLMMMGITLQILVGVSGFLMYGYSKCIVNVEQCLNMVVQSVLGNLNIQEWQ